MITKTRLFSILGLRISGDLAQWTLWYYCHRKRVMFIKRFPEKPPTRRQIRQRNRFRLVARLWQSMRPEQRDRWNAIAALAKLRISGYNLWLYWCIRHDKPTLETLARLTGVDPLANP